MRTSRMSRFAPLTGLGSVALVVTSALLFGYYAYLPDAADVTNHLTDNATRVQLAGYVGVIAAFLLFWFAGTARQVLQGHDERLASIGFGGVVGAASGLTMVYGLMLSAGARAGADSGISEIGAVTLYDTYGNVFVAASGVGLAVFVLAFSLVALRTGFAPSWTGWVGLLFAVGSISPLAYIFFGLSMLYLLIVSVWAFSRQAE